MVAELARQARRVTDEAAMPKEAPEAPAEESPFVAVLRKLSTERGRGQVGLDMLNMRSGRHQIGVR